MEKTQALRVAVLLIGSLLGLVVFHTAAQDLSQEIRVMSRRADDIERQLDAHIADELAIMLARVGVNEAGWGSPADITLVWQITEGHGRTNADRLEWLTRHSSCVGTNREMTEQEARGNCSWSRNLTDSDLEPEGWPAGVIWRNYARRWRQIRQFSKQLVRGRAYEHPCEETPYTWGSRVTDMAQALRRGLRPARCTDSTLNVGFVAADRGSS